MTTDRSTALQLCPLSPYLEAGLAERFNVVRWFDLAPGAQADWLAEHAGEVRAAATGGHIGCPSALMERLPALRIVAINGVGFDKVDLDLARARGVRVTTTPGTLTEDVADLAIGLVIALLRDLPAAAAHVRRGDWPDAERPLARKVSGRRFGILGLGHIGLAVAQRLAAFGPVAYYDPHRKDVPYDYFPDLLALAGASDVLCVAAAANPATRHLVDADVLAALGPDGYLVNISRGSVVDEAALTEALTAGRLAGAALDVFENEPHVPAALRSSDRTVLTPHIASATVETRRAMADMVLANLDAVMAGQEPPAAVA
ncbi:2-hydroxyacid dehydrogenase [Sphingomonas sp. MMS24-J13]|uniref:2-hydroxyacid dehydrogenase n=1 Tax=Sphingomonas sp. MMS24-J13 TaxID=3238686 RepID=UPI003850EDA6